jgi:predicted neuraminidase
MDSRVVYEISERPGLCHCSSIAETADEGLLCVWYEGAYEGSSDTAIRGCSLPRGAERWEPPRDLFRYPGTPLGNPVLFSLQRDGGRARLYLLFSILLGESWTDSVPYVAVSEDGGHSWANPALLFPKKGLMAKTRPLELASGRVLVPLYDEAGYFPVVLVVEDPARWAAGRCTAETMARGIAIQPALTELPDGSIMMLCRTNRGGIWKSLSYNGGHSWSLCAATRLANPDSAIDLQRLDRQTLLLAFNDSAVDRRSLAVALSRDAGRSWSCLAQIEAGPGEYSYPSLLVDSRGSIHVSYTDNRYRIKHVQFDSSWLEEHRLSAPLPTE